MISKEIKIMMIKKEMSMTSLAEKLGVAQSNLSRKFKVGKFTTDDLENIANALGCDLRIEFIEK